MKLLVVDDEGIVLESCRRVLESEGYRVTLAKSADEALAVIEKEDFSFREQYRHSTANSIQIRIR